MINIFGEIGADVTASDVIEQLEAESGDIVNVLISSGGGNAFEGLAIYEALKNSEKTIHTSLLGLGASAGSVIFMAGDTREMGVGSLLMIHNSWTVAMGNSDELSKTQSTLDAIDGRMVAIYQEATGLESEEIYSMLAVDTFMSAEEALEKGFATELQDAEVVAKMAIFSNNNKQKDASMSDDKVPVEQEQEEIEKGMFARFKSWLASEPKAEAEEEMKEEAPKAEESEEVKAEEVEAEVDAPVAEEEGEDVNALKAEIESLKSQLVAQAETKEDPQAKAEGIMQAIEENKVTFAEAKALFAKSSSEVAQHIEGLAVNASGYGKGAQPSNEPSSTVYDQFLALKGADQSAFFSKHKEEIIIQMKKEK